MIQSVALLYLEYLRFPAVLLSWDFFVFSLVFIRQCEVATKLVHVSASSLIVKTESGCKLFLGSGRKLPSPVQFSLDETWSFQEQQVIILSRKYISGGSNQTRNTFIGCA